LLQIIPNSATTKEATLGRNDDDETLKNSPKKMLKTSALKRSQ